MQVIVNKVRVCYWFKLIILYNREVIMSRQFKLRKSISLIISIAMLLSIFCYAVPVWAADNDNEALYTIADLNNYGGFEESLTATVLQINGFSIAGEPIYKHPFPMIVIVEKNRKS